MTWYLTLDHSTYQEAVQNFSWEFPNRYNIAWDCLQKHDDRDAPALHQGYPDGRRETFSFEDLDRLSNQLANVFSSLGVSFGDRVGVLIPQKPASLLSHLACWKLGAISVPLSVLFGTEALKYRLNHSEAVVLVADSTVRGRVNSIRDDCDALEHVIEVDGEETPFEDFEELLKDGSSKFDLANTSRETPAMIIYTSGTTGTPKGVVQCHEVCAGHAPSAYMYFERDIIGRSIGWTPSSWTWIAGIGNLVFPMWHFGRPIVGYPTGGFDPETAFEILEEFAVTDAVIPPTALRMMMDVPSPRNRYDLELKAINAAGGGIDREIRRWGEEELDAHVNGVYGLTEASVVVTSCHDWFEIKDEAVGKSVPGHDVRIADPNSGADLSVGEPGEITIRVVDSPTGLDGYWNDPKSTEEAVRGGWFFSGDLGSIDSDGYLTFHSRMDEMINTSGYRVSPEEIETVLRAHPAVQEVGVIGIPDELRGKVVKAFVELTTDIEPTADLKEELREVVGTELALYKRPREIEFIDRIPLTRTGKVKRSELRTHDVD